MHSLDIYESGVDALRKRFLALANVAGLNGDKQKICHDVSGCFLGEVESVIEKPSVNREDLQTVIAAEEKALDAWFIIAEKKGDLESLNSTLESRKCGIFFIQLFRRDRCFGKLLREDEAFKLALKNKLSNAFNAPEFIEIFFKELPYLESLNSARWLDCEYNVIKAPENFTKIFLEESFELLKDCLKGRQA